MPGELVVAREGSQPSVRTDTKPVDTAWPRGRSAATAARSGRAARYAGEWPATDSYSEACGNCLGLVSL